MTENLSLLELQVEEARAKLARDLAMLRSPQTYREFGAELKSDAKSAVQRAIDDLKARAAANPSAALAIGAGLAWRLVKHPPIATALVGAGVLSLWRTTPARINDDDYLRTAQQRLGEQVSDAAEAVKDYAVEQVVAAREKAVDYTESARETSLASLRGYSRLESLSVMGYNSLKNTNRFDGAWLVPLFTDESVMPLNEIPRYFSSETRRLIDSALEQAWRELKNDAPADPCLAPRKPAGTIVALASVGETDPAKLKSFALIASVALSSEVRGIEKGTDAGD